MRNFLKIIIITVTIVLLMYGFVNAENIDELKQEREKIKEEINKLNIGLEEIEIDLTENLEEIAKLEEKIYEYEDELGDITTNLKKIQTETNIVEEKLTNVEESYTIQKNLLERRLVTLYEEGDTSYLDVLLNSKNIVDFISRYYLIGQIAEYDSELLESIKKEKEEIENLENILAEKKAKLKEIKTTEEKSLVALENAKVVKNSYMSKLTKEEKELQEKLDLYKTEVTKLDLQILSLTIGENINSEYIGGDFIWPTPGYTTITSPFGMRFHPILKVYKLHNGMDIGAPYGASIVAVNSGVVTTASYLSAYGETVIIDHGGGIYSLYAHGSEILVEVGDIVEKGDLIMKVGSSGLSTGAHLHFGISANGTYVDPYVLFTAKENEEDTKIEE